MGIQSIENDDTFVVSYPKSGNTWMRFIIANLLTSERVTFRNLNQFVPGIYGFKNQVNEMSSPRFIKTHDPHFSRFPKVVYIYRDLRDVVISYFHFQKSQNLFDGSISEFIRSTHLEQFGGWESHVRKAFKFQEKHPDRILMLSYEEMLESLPQQVERIQSFCNISGRKSVDEIVNLCSFDSLKKTEQQFGKVYDEIPFSFFRAGKAGQWKQELRKEDVKFLESNHSELFKLLKYSMSK